MKRFSMLALLLALVTTMVSSAADKKISDFTYLPAASFSTADLLVIVDTSATETKNTTLGDFDLRYFQNSLASNLTTTTTGVSIGGGTGSVLTPATININTASSSLTGLLTSSDWTTFNNKQAPGSYIVALTGDVTASGPGSAAATIANSAVSNSKMASMAGHTYKGNNTGSTTAPIDVTASQLTADLDLFSSSLSGVVPASGGGTTNFLRADGTWASPSGGGGANTSLSNLVTTNINQDLLWDTPGTYKIGDYGNSLARVHADDFVGTTSGFAISSILGTFNDLSGNIVMNIDTKYLFDTAGVHSLNWDVRAMYDASNGDSLNWNSRKARNSAGDIVFDWDNLQIKYQTSGNTAIDWGIAELHDSSDLISVKWSDRLLVNAAGNNVADWAASKLKDTSNVSSVDWQTRVLTNSVNINTVNYDNGSALDPVDGTLSIDWASRLLYSVSGTLAMLDYSGTEAVGIGAHIRSDQSGSAVSIAAAGALGSTGTAQLFDATDVKGQIQLTPGGTGITSGSQATITFGNTYTAGNPIIILSPVGAGAGNNLIKYTVVNASSSGFLINFGVAGSSGTTYILNYMVME